MLCGMKIVLVTRQSSLYASITEYMQQIQEINSNCYDQQLLQLILDCDLTVDIISTPFFGPVIEHLLDTAANQGSKVNIIAEQLKTAGYEAEAGSLMLKHRGTNPMLNTLDSALSALTSWLKK
ncbi:NBAS subunit of NRZ tethering complex-like [Amphiura filiformis]|uniref:NBAS subunit of NRZ tethering complex-like n=1 Tax=Amphiura filiformis TaxID=82378 RepID=UPI003B20E8F4